MLKFDYTWIKEIYDNLIDLDEIFQIVTGLKILSVVLLLLYWYFKFIKFTDTNEGTVKRSPLTPYDIIEGIFIVMLVISYDKILYQLDTWLNAIENFYAGFEVRSQALDISDTEITEENELTWTAAIKSIANALTEVIRDPFFLVLKFIEVIAWLIDLGIYVVFLAVRFFFIGLLRILGAVALACAVVPQLRKWFWNWLSLIVAVYLTIIPYMLINGFTNAIYDGAELALSLIPYPSGFAMSIVMFIIVAIKLILYPKATQLIYKIFNS